MSNTFISKAKLKLTKIHANAKQHPEPEACNFIKKDTLAQIFSCECCEISKNTFFYRTPLVAASELRITGHILRNKQKKKCICIHDIIRLIIMKMKMKMGNRSHRYYINRPRSRHGHKYSKYKTSLSMIVLV